MPTMFDYIITLIIIDWIYLFIDLEAQQQLLELSGKSHSYVKLEKNKTDEDKSKYIFYLNVHLPSETILQEIIYSRKLECIKG